MIQILGLQPFTFKPAAGYRIGRPDRLGPGAGVLHGRNPFHYEKRLQGRLMTSPPN